ncbi:helix-turn-helix domain-containing protein [Kaustia mangrovi]|uniref:Helix-turn-helix domain-containing protein n=1 Tax=Kaustia mangrovi TaxID=2593653 RepID=A0A7S8HBI6_9HYPH|nr:AraC family transcriptional regulator [Kaustia mangrovi]QPC42526.1 helix-turn-helix domain-containing protein [Kaustia mangrovi]
MLTPAPTIRIRSFLQIAPYLAKRGVSSIDFFQRLGISPNIFQNPDIWLPRAQCFHVANEMVSATQDPFGGVYVGQMTELGSLGAWGDLILGASNVAQACAHAATNASMLHQGSDVRFVIEGRTARILYRFTGRQDVDPRQFIFGSLAVLRKVPLMAGEPSAIRVSLSAARGRGDDALEECLGPNIEMGTGHDMIEFDRGLLEMPLRGRDVGEASKATDALRTTVETAGLLIDQISDHRQLGLEAAAKTLGMSVRTLQRRLKFCGVDFEDLLDQTRRDEALRLLAERGHTMTEIAYSVGYSDSAHFTRAFKRWTGTAPSYFRADS